MKDLLTRLTENISDSFAHVTDQNEMYTEGKTSDTDITDAIETKIEELNAQLKAIQAEIEFWEKEIKSPNKTHKSFKDNLKKVQRLPDVDAYDNLVRDHYQFWWQFNGPKRNRRQSSCDYNDYSSSCHGGYSGYGGGGRC